jgi:uncharacterized membrane protein YgaE (UPF0421/DUF939 family)
VIERLRSRVGDRDVVVELQLALKMTIGGTLSWWLAVELGARRPIFAALVPLVAMTGDPFAAVSVSLGRIVGVFIGVGLGVVFVHVAMGSTLRVAIVLLIATTIGVLFRVGGRPNLEVPIAALFMLGTAIAAVGHLGVQRIWETAIGAAVAILVASLLWPPNPARELRRQLERVRHQLVGDLLRIADDLATGGDETASHMDDVRAHSLDAVREVFALDAARRALRWSPLRHSDAQAVDDLGRRIGIAARTYRHTRAVARDVIDLRVQDASLAAATRDLADALDRVLTGEDTTEPYERATAALAEPLTGNGELVAFQLRQLLADFGAMRR